ncbi:MAG: zinc-binding alcohol dehydrogenase [Pseudomonadota bacterium]
MAYPVNALFYREAGRAELTSIERAREKENSVYIQSSYSGISRGTEALVYHGLVPEAEWSRMACPHQVGAFSFPISYGYALVGEVLAVGRDVTRLKTGDVVFALHPHHDHAVVDEAMAHQVPVAIPPKRAVLSANMETALNAFWDGEVVRGERCCVIGAGVVGLLTGYLLKRLGRADVTLVDTNRDRQAIAATFGLAFQTPDTLSDEFDLLFHTSASASGLQTAIDHAAFEARIIEMSWYGDKPVTLQLGGAFHSRRLKLISSQVGHVSPSKRETHTLSKRMREAIDLLDDPVLDALLEPNIEFADLPHHLPRIFGAQSPILCQVVHY